jgi:hypothetical protein
MRRPFSPAAGAHDARRARARERVRRAPLRGPGCKDRRVRAAGTEPAPAQLRPPPAAATGRRQRRAPAPATLNTQACCHPPAVPRAITSARGALAGRPRRPPRRPRQGSLGANQTPPTLSAQPQPRPPTPPPRAPPRRTEHVLGAGGADDDLRAHRRLADLDAAVPVLRQFPQQQLVQLGEEHAIGHELGGGAGRRRGRGQRSGRASERGRWRAARGSARALPRGAPRAAAACPAQAPCTMVRLHGCCVLRSCSELWRAGRLPQHRSLLGGRCSTDREKQAVPPREFALAMQPARAAACTRRSTRLPLLADGRGCHGCSACGGSAWLRKRGRGGRGARPCAPPPRAAAQRISSVQPLQGPPNGRSCSARGRHAWGRPRGCAAASQPRAGAPPPASAPKPSCKLCCVRSYPGPAQQTDLDTGAIALRPARPQHRGIRYEAAFDLVNDRCEQTPLAASPATALPVKNGHLICELNSVRQGASAWEATHARVRAAAARARRPGTLATTSSEPLQCRRVS